MRETSHGDVGDPDPSDMTSVGRRGLLLVMSSPSGAGKTTLAKRLLADDTGITLSVSCTTRQPRPGERDGVDYHFVDQARFESMVSDDGLLEWAYVFDNQYGTPRAATEALIADGRDVLFDIDWQGTQQLADKLPADVVRVFILPPSIAALESRLRNRGQDSEDVVLRRMARARDEISHWAQYDYVIVNREVDASLARLKAIVEAERQRRSRQVGLYAFVSEMVTQPAP